MAIFPFAVGCVLSAEVAFRVRFEGLDLSALKSMAPLLIAYLVFVELATFGPLLMQWILTVGCYPILHKGFEELSERVQQRRWRILHGR